MNKIRRLVCVVGVMALAGTTVSAGVIQGKIAGGEGGSTVVWVEGLSGKVPETDTQITHVFGGAFDPGFSIGFVGREFVFRNEDKVLHNTHLYMKLAYQKDVSGRPLVLGLTVYNVALPRLGEEVGQEQQPSFSGQHGLGVELNGKTRSSKT